MFSNTPLTRPDFASHYPQQLHVANGTNPPTPQAWLDKLASIKLPENNPVATLKGCCSISYGDGKDGMGPEICSFTAGCHTDSDLFTAPDGTFVVSNKRAPHCTARTA